MVTSGAAPLIVYAFRRVRRRTSTGAFQTCDAGRAGVHLPSEAGTPDMTHRTCCRGSRGSVSRSVSLPAPAAERLGPIVLLFLGLPTQKESLPVGPFLERFLDRGRPKPSLSYRHSQQIPMLSFKKSVAQEIHGS